MISQILIDIFSSMAYTVNVRNSMSLETGVKYMELAKITAKGQITIPVQIRKMLGVKDGDKVVFWNEGNKIIIENSTRLAIREAQEAFTGLADELGLKTEEDVVKLCREVRKEKWEKKHEDNG